MVVLPSVPRLVVTNITPAAAFIPYTAHEAASFNIVTDSTSLGLIYAMLRSTPSTRIRGPSPPLYVECPRTNNETSSAPGAPVAC